MRITIFGSSGRIGREAVNYALKKGYDVVAFMRPNRYLEVEHPNLTCIKGEFTDMDKLKKAVLDSDAVVVTLGGFFQESLRICYYNLMQATEEVGPKRLIALFTPCVVDKGDKFCWNTVFPNVWTSLWFRKGRKGLKICSDRVRYSNLDWTIVRYLEPVDGEYTGDVKIGFDVKQKIRRADVAAFMVDQVEDTRFIRQMPIVGS